MLSDKGEACTKNILRLQSQTSLKVMLKVKVVKVVFFNSFGRLILKVKVVKVVFFNSFGRLIKITIKRQFSDFTELVFEFL